MFLGLERGKSKMKKYKKIVTWKKKPQIENIIGGFLFSFFSLFLIVGLLHEFEGLILAIVFTLMFCFGIRLIYNGWGIGKDVDYILKRK